MAKLSLVRDSSVPGNTPGPIDDTAVGTANTSPDLVSLALVGPVSPQQEIEWKNSLRNLEYKIEAYNDARTPRQGSFPALAAVDVAEAMEQVGESHPDIKVKRHWKEKANTFRNAREYEKDGIMEEMGKGLLLLLTTPFMLVGAVLQAAGGILDGVGKILKGIGRFTQQLILHWVVEDWCW